MTPAERAQWVALAVSAICGWAIPAVVDLITTSKAANSAKAALAVALSTLAGALSATAFTAGERWTSYLLAIAVAFVNAITAHATGYSNLIQQATKNFGIGPRTPPAADPLANQGATP